MYPINYSFRNLQQNSQKLLSGNPESLRFSNRPSQKSNSVFSLQDLECLVDSLVEIMEACLSEVPPGSLWLQQWAELVQRFAFQYNPAFQPRAIVVLGCISRNATDMDIRALLQILVS